MIVIDTHVLIWWVSNPEKLSVKVKKILQKEKNNGSIIISSITVWEIYMLVKKGRLKLTMDADIWLAEVESLPYVRFTPVDNTIAANSVTLPGDFHNDPADRMIVATAKEQGAVLVTADERIRQYAHVRSLW